MSAAATLAYHWAAAHDLPRALTASVRAGFAAAHVSGPAEAQTGGVRINMIPKTGGNVFRGDATVLYSSTRFQSSNITDALINRGYKSPGRLEKIWDVTLK